MISVTVILSSHIHITWVSTTSDSQRAYQLYKTAYFIIEFHVGNSDDKFSLGMLGKKMQELATVGTVGGGKRGQLSEYRFYLKPMYIIHIMLNRL